MVCSPKMASAAILLFCLSALADRPAQAQTPPNGVPEIQRPERRRMQRPVLVTAVAISDDGRRIAATCFVPAMNRPGTDWRTFARTWDLETGEQTVVEGATNPLLMTGDGRTLVMGLSERKNIRSRFGDCRLAVWEFGQQEPSRVLDREIKVKDDKAIKEDNSRALPRNRNAARDVVSTVPSVRTITLLRDNRVLAGYADGALRLWRTDAPADNGSSLLDEREPDAELRLVGGMITSVLWNGQHRPELVTLFPLENRAFDRTRSEGRQVDQKLVQVRVLNDKFEQVEVMTPDDAMIENTLTSGHGTKPFGEMQRYAGLLTRELVKRIWPFAGTPELDAYPNAMVDKRGTWAAISARGRVWVVNGYGRVDHVVPFGGGTVGASHNVLFLAVADADQSLRVWDVRKRRLVRTLSPQPDEEPEEVFTVAALQTIVEFGNPEKNRERLVEDATTAAKAGARIIVFPEAAATGYFDAEQNRTWHVSGRPLGDGLRGADPADVAETVPGPSTEALAQVARNFGVYITVPLVEADRRTGRYYNTVLLLGPDGQPLIHYRKRDPSPGAEASWATPGDLGDPVVDTPFGRLGVLVSHDVLQHAQAMEDKGTDVLLCPLAWVEKKESDWFDVRLPGIAREHTLTIVAANWGVPRTRSDDSPPDWHGFGHSRIIGPDGAILAGAPAGANRSQTERVFAQLPLPATLLRE